MDPIKDIRSQQEQIGLESDSLEPVHVPQATGVIRQRQCTERGKAYIAHLRSTDCQSIGKRVQRQIKEIDSFATTEKVDVVERNLTSFRVTVEEFTRRVLTLLDNLETEDDLKVANDWFAKQSKQVSDFTEKTVRWISSAKEITEQNLEIRSQASSR